MGECPKLTNTWEANKALPPTPNKSVCDCMVKAASCVPKSNVTPKDIKHGFDFICTKSSNCVGISKDSAKGIYGAYSMCDDKAKFAHVLDVYYKSQNKADKACDFNGAATTQKSSIDDSCKALLDAASDINKQAATATAPVNGKITGTSTGAPGKTTEESFAARSVTTSKIGLVSLAAQLCVIAAFTIGAGAVLL